MKVGKLSQKASLTPTSLVKREASIITSPGQLMKANGRVDSEMVLEFKTGRMVPAMKVNGDTIGK